MKLKALYCPYCAGTVKIDQSSKKREYYCIHCGQPIYVDDEVKRSEHKEIIEDVAKIQYVNYKEKVEFEKYQVYKQNLERYYKHKKLAIIISSSILLAGILITVICETIVKDDDSFLWVLGLFFIWGSILGLMGGVCMQKPKSPDEQQAYIKEMQIEAEKEKSFNENFWGKH
ncbi:hypothetical protein SAMN05216413_2613 [Ruminococcaceae bacterium KH2T8]|nr:hypothetical protein SAMN05216413_2613 [Ruminococcaceae bacterium KH2T8]